MSTSINTRPSIHQLVVSDLSNAQLARSTNTVLRSLDQEQTSGTPARRGERAQGGAQTTLLETGTLGRLRAHIAHLGSRTSFVTEQNNKVVAAFAQALERRDVPKVLRDYAVAQLQSRAQQLSSEKTLLKFADLGAVLQQQDAHALTQVLSYLPAQAEGQSTVFSPKEDGPAFKALAAKHGLDTPELRERFRAGLEARIFGNANNARMGPEGTMNELAAFAEQAALGARPGSSYDQPVKELFAEFPVGLERPKILQDGPFQVSGYPDHGVQTFIFFKRTSAENIPYDCQGAMDQRAAALSGSRAAADTPAGKGQWTDVPQKFHFSVDKAALHDGKAWPLLHKLLASEENPFLQWKIGNPHGLNSGKNGELADIKRAFMEEGPRLKTASGEKKDYAPIPVLEQKIAGLINDQKARQTLFSSGAISERDFAKFQTEIDVRQAELEFIKGKYHEKLENASQDRCVDGAQFTLYTQHDPEQPWQPGEVQQYTRFLAKLEQVMTDAGIAPGQLPESDVTVPGLRYATFRDEAVGEAAEKKGVEYQSPPPWLLDQYRSTPFYQLAAQAVAAQVDSQALQA